MDIKSLKSDQAFKGSVVNWAYHGKINLFFVPHKVPLIFSIIIFHLIQNRKKVF